MRSLQDDYRTLLLRGVVLTWMAALWAASGHAEELMLDLSLVSPSATENTFEVEYELSNIPQFMGQPPGGILSQTTNTTGSGNVQLTTNVSFDPVTHAATVSDVDLTGGRISLTDMQIIFDFTSTPAGNLGTVVFDAKNIVGELNTPTPPGSVGNPSAGDFSTNDHLLILDEGVISMTPTGLLIGIVPPFPPHDLSVVPINGFTTDETAMLNVMLDSIVGNVATYNVELKFPVAFSTEFPPVQGVIETLTISPDDPGTVVATGQIQRIIPEPSSILLSIIGAVLAIFLVRRM